MTKIRLSSQKLKDSGHRVIPLTSWYFVDGSYLLITLTKKRKSDLLVMGYAYTAHDFI